MVSAVLVAQQTVTAQNASGNCGDSNVAVEITIDDATGMAAFEFDLYFDGTVLQDVDAVKPTANAVRTRLSGGQFRKCRFGRNLRNPSGPGPIWHGGCKKSKVRRKMYE